MKSNAKSSITLPPNELKLVEGLRKKLKLKSKVEVIRQGLYLLKARSDRASLRAAYAHAARQTKEVTIAELLELDHLSDEGL
ncbi:MAG: hypothetical protein COT74_10805 [Bdellovibrionales bacterium CG10_big_fil_rev_8_21_14_0_10_45_34]|nr:MAG: hypothetical protein COT74_10805 [Bdellovibrionales bacterium CG10_big_fil_rev_8_21_14_0_10_45_34]